MSEAHYRPVACAVWCHLSLALGTKTWPEPLKHTWSVAVQMLLCIQQWFIQTVFVGFTKITSLTNHTALNILTPHKLSVTVPEFFLWRPLKVQIHLVQCQSVQSFRLKSWTWAERHRLDLEPLNWTGPSSTSAGTATRREVGCLRAQDKLWQVFFSFNLTLNMCLREWNPVSNTSTLSCENRPFLLSAVRFQF